MEYLEKREPQKKRKVIFINDEERPKSYSSLSSLKSLNKQATVLDITSEDEIDKSAQQFHDVVHPQKDIESKGTEMDGERPLEEGTKRKKQIRITNEDEMDLLLGLALDETGNNPLSSKRLIDEIEDHLVGIGHMVMSLDPQDVNKLMIKDKLGSDIDISSYIKPGDNYNPWTGDYLHKVKSKLTWNRVSRHKNGNSLSISLLNPNATQKEIADMLASFSNDRISTDVIIKDTLIRENRTKLISDKTKLRTTKPGQGFMLPYHELLNHCDYVTVLGFYGIPPNNQEARSIEKTWKYTEIMYIRLYSVYSNSMDAWGIMDDSLYHMESIDPNYNDTVIPFHKSRVFFCYDKDWGCYMKSSHHVYQGLIHPYEALFVTGIVDAGRFNYEEEILNQELNNYKEELMFLHDFIPNSAQESITIPDKSRSVQILDRYFDERRKPCKIGVPVKDSKGKTTFPLIYTKTTSTDILSPLMFKRKSIDPRRTELEERSSDVFLVVSQILPSSTTDFYGNEWSVDFADNLTVVNIKNSLDLKLWSLVPQLIHSSVCGMLETSRDTFDANEFNKDILFKGTIERVVYESGKPKYEATDIYYGVNAINYRVPQIQWKKTVEQLRDTLCSKK